MRNNDMSETLIEIVKIAAIVIIGFLIIRALLQAI